MHNGNGERNRHTPCAGTAHGVCGLLTCGLVVLTVAGCGRGGPERVVVTGSVTYQGKPLPGGTICFIPCDGTEGPSTIEGIIAGQYKAGTSGGLPVGAYQVAIRAFHERSSRAGSEDVNADSPAAKFGRLQYLPEKYNLKTELKITVESGSRSLMRDFALNE